MLRVADDSAGKTAKCPKCLGLAKIPAASGGTPADPLGFPHPTDFSAPLPSSKPSDPFGALNQPASPAGQAPAFNPFSDPGAKPNPFGGGGGGAGGFSSGGTDPFAPAGGQVNPYASPTPTTAYAPYTPQYGSGQRVGLPWEREAQSVHTWWETVKLVVGSSQPAFRMMHLRGGLGKPMVFAMIGLGIGSIANAIFQMGMNGLMFAGGGMPAEVMGAQMIGQLLGAIIGTLLGATVGALFYAAILHVCLMVVGGERNGYEATFRVISYTNGSFALFQLIPFFGPCVGVIWQIVVTIIGLAEAHETTVGKAALAYFIPWLVCGALFAVTLAVVFAVAAANQ